MTREEAKKEIIDMANTLQIIPNTPTGKAVSMALKALEQEPCEDCISRQAVLSMQYRIDDSATLSTRDVVNVDDIEDLPPVTPQPKTGHWILTDDDFVYCSECEDSYYPIPIDASWYYCPHCGAKMVEPQESEDKENVKNE